MIILHSSRAEVSLDELFQPLLLSLRHWCGRSDSDEAYVMLPALDLKISQGYVACHIKAIVVSEQLHETCHGAIALSGA